MLAILCKPLSYLSLCVRLHADVCRTERMDCDFSNDTTPKVRDMCDGETECEVEANNEVLGNTCRMTYKYLEIKYDCVDGNNPNRGEWSQQPPEQG